MEVAESWDRREVRQSLFPARLPPVNAAKIPVMFRLSHVRMSFPQFREAFPRVEFTAGKVPLLLSPVPPPAEPVPAALPPVIHPFGKMETTPELGIPPSAPVGMPLLHR